MPRHLREVVARFTRSLRESSAIDQGSGVSARFAVAAAETVAAAALRRAALTGESRAVARPVDLESVPDVLRGKLEFASGEEGRESEHLEHLLRRATADTARARLRGLDLTPLAEAVSQSPVRTGERVPAAEVVAALPARPAVDAVLTEVAKRLDAAGTEEPGPMASAAELALELLFLTRRLAKDEGDDDTVRYGRPAYSAPWERSGGSVLGRRQVIAGGRGAGGRGRGRRVRPARPPGRRRPLRPADDPGRAQAPTRPRRARRAPSSARPPTCPVGGGTVYESLEVVVTQPEAGRFDGLSAVCTHTGCIVDKVVDGLIECPCHGSRYHLDGTVASGPAPRALTPGRSRSSTAPSCCPEHSRQRR